jgi:hypothetical protein
MQRILVLHRLDLQAAAQLAGQLARSGVADDAIVVTVLDPVLHTYALANGLPQVHLLDLPGCAGAAAEAAARALASARLVSGQADDLMAELIPQARGAAWCTFWHRTLHTTAYGCRSAARALAQATPDDTVHLLLPDAPLRYGYHSFVPGLMFYEGLRLAGRAPKLYVNPLPAVDAALLPDPASAPQGLAVDLLCHLPTCFGDGALFSAELRASGRSVLVMPSQVFDVATDGLARCSLVPAEQLAAGLTAAQRSALAAVLDRLSTLLAEQLQPLLSSTRMLQTQVAALVEGYRLNALMFMALQAHFGARPPRTLLISNHDVGLHGAFISFARLHGLRTVMVPHAKIFNSVVPSYGHDLLCLTHALQGGEVIDLDGYRMPTGTLDFAQPLRMDPAPARPLALLGIVLNAVSAKALCLVDMATYLGGLRRLLDWCRAQGVVCRIRCRPNGSLLSVLSAALNVSSDDLIGFQQGSLVEFAEGCELVVGYDVPTSGVLDLLAQGIPVLQALCRRLEPEERRIVDAEVVPLLSVDQALQRLGGFVADPLALWTFRREQQTQLARASAGAQPLRAWL